MISDDNTVSIDDSLQEMAWEIVRQESVEDPGKGSRLWELNDIVKHGKTIKGKQERDSVLEMLELRYIIRLWWLLNLMFKSM